MPSETMIESAAIGRNGANHVCRTDARNSGGRSSLPTRVAICLICLTVVWSSAAHSQVARWKLRLVGGGYTVGTNPLNPLSVYGQGAGSSLYQTVDGGTSWTQVGNSGIFDMRQILVHPKDTSTIFVVGEVPAGLKRSSDGGKTWSTVIPNLLIDGESIAVDPSHPDTMYAGNLNNGDIYRSTDRGVNWTHTGVTGTELCTIAVRPDSSNVIYAGTGNGTISKSTDQGATWKKVKSGGSDEIPKIVIDLSNPAVAYAIGFAGTASADGLWKTTDGGESWNLVSLQGISLWALEVDQSNPSTVYVGTFGIGILNIYKSTDGGATMNFFGSGIPGGNAWNLKAHPQMPLRPWLANRGAGVANSGLYQYVQSRGDVHGALLDSTSNDMIKTGSITLTLSGERADLAAGGGKFRFDYFEDAATLSTTLHVEAYPYRVKDIPFSFFRDSSQTRNIRLQRLPTASLGGTLRDSSSLQAVQGKISLTITTQTGSVKLTDTTDAAGGFQFNNLYVSAPPIVQYSRLQIEPAFPFSYRSMAPVVLDTAGLHYDVKIPKADAIVVSVSDSAAYAHYYTDELDSLRLNFHLWNNRRSGQAPLTRVKELKKKFLIYYTGDRTSSLTKPEMDSLSACIAGGCNLLLSGQNIGAGNDTAALFSKYFGVGHLDTFSGFALSGSADELFSGLHMNLLGGSGASNQTLPEAFKLVKNIGTTLFTYDISDTVPQIAGIGFQKIGNGSKAILVGFGFEAINFAAARQSFMQKTLEYFDRPLSAPQHSFALTPGEYALEQNYPNPFNPATTIRFVLRDQGFTTLAVYDLLGRRVTTLVSEKLAPGTYSMPWNSGSVPSGVYFYRLTAGSFSATRRMAVIK